MRFVRFVFPLVFGGALLAPPASADPKTLDAATEAKRTALFEEGKALHLSGKHAEAAVKLKQVVEIRRSPQALRALGLAEQAAGKLLDARGHFDDALRLAQESGPASEVEPAKASLAQVVKQVPHVHLDMPAGAADPTVTVDGVSAPVAGGSVDVDPGPHKISVTVSGMETFTQDVQATAGEVTEVKVTLAKASSMRSLQGPIGIGIAGLGGAGLIAGAVTGVLALTTHDELTKVCSGDVCPKEQLAKLDTYHVLGTTSTVSLIAGGVLVAAGTVLWVTAPRPASKASVRVTPLIGMGSAGVRVTF